MARIEIDPNYSSPTFSRATAATDPFKKEDVQQVAAALSTHDHSTGKGLLIPFATTIPNGSITSAMIADATIDTADLKDGAVTSAKILDGTIATADIAAHAISQTGAAVGSTANPTTTSTSLVDIPDMSVTMTTTGGDVLVFLVASFTNTATTAIAQTAFRIDSGADSGAAVIPYSTVANALVSLTNIGIFTALAAGSHTFRARWATPTGTLASYSTYRTLIVLELKR